MQEILFERFGYELYSGGEADGWLFNYNIEKLADSSMVTVLYFVADKSNVYCKIPFYPSFLVESDDLDVDEEVLKRRYHIEKIERVVRQDLSLSNHLNIKSKEYLKVFFKNENSYLKAVKDLKGKKQKENIYGYFYDKEVKNTNISILEYDISYEIAAVLELNVRVGKWYIIKNNTFIESTRIEFPKLKIMAFDIETTKSPLKFPNPEIDEIMMISLSFGDEGLLITNRTVVSEDILPFEYFPKEDIHGSFNISNEKNEEFLLIKFLQVIQENKPNILTTYNGNFFDFPFIEKRLQKYNLDLKDISIICKAESYTSNFMVHLDCYRWVQRDSYLPMGSQGLKKVTQIKLGYFPDEVDPEEMVDMAKNDPDKLASYSVSDSVATYYLYMNYIHPFVFSLSSLIPYPAYDILSKGSGTLCEALLISEALNKNIIIPPKKKEGDNIFYYKNGIKYLADNLSYIGGHVECLKTGIFREDFEYDFSVNTDSIKEIEEFIKTNYKDVDENIKEIDKWIKDKSQPNSVKRIKNTKIDFKDRPYIYHLDVGAMYPNIILTYKLQPTAIVTEDICIRCDFNVENSCKKKMKWKLRADYFPATLEEYKMIGLNVEDKEINKIKEYNRNIYGKTTYEDICEIENIVCQRENPFFVDTVRKFRDQRYFYKRKLKEAKSEKIPNKNLIIIFESLQVAHKVVLNSFYGYAMRKGSRWYSMEMAAMVCNVGGNIIKKAREFVDKIGITLELDTDGIWCLVPQSFNWVLNNKNILKDYLNKIIIDNFTNDQYQERIGDTNKFKQLSVNSIEFELDGPYKAMVLPASLEKEKNVKKKYVVINMKNKISELKGFEFKRRGELNLVKKYQEEIFNNFMAGNDLNSCYKELESITRNYLSLIKSKGEYITDDEIFNLFSESKNMSKTFIEYEGRKTLATLTIIKLSEIIGKEILEEKNIKCEFIISKYPEGEAVVNRTLPTLLFSLEKNGRRKLLQKWCKKVITTDDIRDIIDWEYYKQRLETVVLKIIKIPAWKQNINILEEVEVPDWIKKYQKSTLMDYIGCEIIKENNKEIIKDNNKEIIKDNNKEIIKDNNKEIIKDNNKESIKNNNKEIIKDNNKEIIKDNNKEIIKDNNKEIIKDNNKESIKDNNKEIIKDNNKESIKDNNKEIIKDNNKEIIKDNNKEIIKDNNKENIKNNNKEIITYREYILANKSKWLENFSNNQEFITILKIEIKDTIKIYYLYKNNIFIKEIDKIINIEYNNKNIIMTKEEYNNRKDYFNHYLIQNYRIIEPEYFMCNIYNQIFRQLFYHQSDNIDDNNINNNISTTNINNNKNIIFIISLDNKAIIKDYNTYILTKNKEDIKNPTLPIIECNIKREIKKRIKDKKIIIINKRDKQIKDILNKKEYNNVILEINIERNITIGVNEEYLIKELKLLEEEYNRIKDISSMGIPLLNINERVLDYLYYNYIIKDKNIIDNKLEDNKLEDKNIIDNKLEDNYLEKILKDEYYKEGYYNTTSIEIELQGILILSIINKENIITEIKCIKEFNRIKSFILWITNKKRDMLGMLNRWITQESIFISKNLRKELMLLKQKYIIETVSKIKDIGCEIVSVNKEIIIININKHDGIEEYIKYINSKISKYIKIKILRIYDKLIYASPIDYFYINKTKENIDNNIDNKSTNHNILINNKDNIDNKENDIEGSKENIDNNIDNKSTNHNTLINKTKENIDNNIDNKSTNHNTLINKTKENIDNNIDNKSTNHNTLINNKVIAYNKSKIPKRYLIDIFNNKVDNNYLYSLVIRNKDIDIPLLLKIYSFISSDSSTRSNIYRLLKKNEFSDKEEYRREYIAIDIECRCGSDNILRILTYNPYGSYKTTSHNKCNRCLSKYSIEDIEAAVLLYINNKIIEYYKEDRICERCRDIKKNRINNKCKCGGIYKIDRDIEFLRIIKESGISKRIDELVEEIQYYI